MLTLSAYRISAASRPPPPLKTSVLPHISAAAGRAGAASGGAAPVEPSAQPPTGNGHRATACYSKENDHCATVCNNKGSDHWMTVCNNKGNDYRVTVSDSEGNDHYTTVCNLPMVNRGRVNCRIEGKLSRRTNSRSKHSANGASGSTASTCDTVRL
jgi:hypothetical protein